MKRIIFIVVVIILVAILGVFIWRTWGSPNISKDDFIWYEDFKITQTAEGQVIVQEDTGLSLTIPKDWKTESGIGGHGLYFYSPDFELDEVANRYILPFPKTGCVFEISIDKGDKDNDASDYARNWIEICTEGELGMECDYEVIKINGEDALKHTSILEEEFISGESVRIQIPHNVNAYAFEAYLFGQDKKECGEEFNNILKSIIIK